MKKFIFIFSFLIGSMSMFANEVINENEVIDELIDIEIPIKLDAPNEVYNLLSIITADEPMGILENLIDLIGSLSNLVLGDTIEVEILGIPGGVLILSTNAELELWEVSLNEIAVNAIVNGEEGVTLSAEWVIIPGLLKVTFIIATY